MIIKQCLYWLREKTASQGARGNATRNPHRAVVAGPTFIDMKPSPDTPLPPSRPRRSRLTVHLAIVLILKVILLTLLWHAFIKPNKISVDVEAMSGRIAGSAPPNTPTSSGEKK